MTIILASLAALLLLVSLLPVLKVPHGIVRGPAFARLQWTAMAVLLILPTALFWGRGHPAILLVLIAIIAINAVYIAKFTRVWPVQVPAATASESTDTTQQISLISSNIKLSNRAYHRFHDMLSKTDADIVIVIEPDADWLKNLSALRQSHPHFVEKPLDTGYGIALYSRLPLKNITVTDRVTKGVPSIHCTVTLPNGEDISLYALHPEPPTATHDTKGRDSEIGQVGLAAARDPLPAIVTGDLNDVAWSTTTRRFQRLSGLVDPRVGRGFFNTFHAHYPMFRWPLDHIFHDRRFKLISLKRLPDIGSDHFPIFASLVLTKAPSGAKIPHDPAEAEEVTAMIQSETRRPRAPIGTTWETDD